MSYLVLARKYRPQTFDEVIGQEHITKSLQGMISEKKPRQAFLFCGSRGTGKTTCARILAREINARADDGQPTLDLGLDSSLDVIEIDGASNTGVDDVRALRENAHLMPMSGGFKVYIIDEVHMLSDAAFNALLKILEEPPPHVIFIFATTAPHKLPTTVLSRCQRYDFKRIPVKKIAAQLRMICDKDSIKAGEDALFAIARAAQGGMRDALSLLDQLSATTEEITLSVINDLFGMVESKHMASLAQAVVNKDLSAALLVLEKVADHGKDMKRLLGDMITYFRDLMVMKVGGKTLEALIDLPRAQKEALFALSSGLQVSEIIRCLDLLVDAQNTARVTGSSRIAIELALAKMTAGAAAPVVQAPQASVQTARVAQPPASAAIKQPPRPSATRSAPAPANEKEKEPTGTFLNNKKGEVVLSKPQSGTVLLLEEIKERWNEFTHTVSQSKISVGSYLQEGVPWACEGTTLKIAFSPEDLFHKECLETPANRDLLIRVLSEMFGVKASVMFVIDKDVVRQETPPVKSAVNMFKGEVINEWHSEGIKEDG